MNGERKKRRKLWGKGGKRGGNVDEIEMRKGIYDVEFGRNSRGGT